MMINNDFTSNNVKPLIRPFYCFVIALLLVSIVFSSYSVYARPKTKTIHGYSLDGFARVKVKNMTTKDLACWVAIDGKKTKFRLPSLNESQWYTTNDKRYTYANISTWCDYIELHPEYQKYNRG